MCIIKKLLNPLNIIKIFTFKICSSFKSLFKSQLFKNVH